MIETEDPKLVRRIRFGIVPSIITPFEWDKRYLNVPRIEIVQIVFDFRQQRRIGDLRRHNGEVGGFQNSVMLTIQLKQAAMFQLFDMQRSNNADYPVRIDTPGQVANITGNQIGKQRDTMFFGNLRARFNKIRNQKRLPAGKADSERTS